MSDRVWSSAAQMRRIGPYFPLSHGVVDDLEIVDRNIFVIRDGLRRRSALPHWPPRAAGHIR